VYLIFGALIGFLLVGVIKEYIKSEQRFYRDVARKNACDLSCAPRKSSYDRQLDTCDCEARK